MNKSKYQEALDEIKSTEKYDLFDEYIDDIFEKVKVFADDDENIKTLQELVDKATPKKPTYDYGLCECKCVNCDFVLGYVDENDEEPDVEQVEHCYHCGQALDWSEDEKI